jgi:sec-independent protein translocase protein TatA
MELIVLLFIVVLLFGATRLPQIGRGLGEGIRNFKKGIRAAAADDDEKDAPEKQDART